MPAERAALDLAQIGERLIGAFDHEPEIKARIAQALVSGTTNGKPRPRRL